MEQLNSVIMATESGKKQDEKDQLDSIRDLNKRVMLELLEKRRSMLRSIHDENIYDEEIIRNMENNLDLEEFRLNKR